MKKNFWMILILAIGTSCGLLRADDQIAEPTPATAEKTSLINTATKPVKGVVETVKNVGEGTKELVEDTVEETRTKPPIVGTIEGLHKGSEKVVDKTVKGAYKAATLGFGELDEVRKEQPVREPDYENIDSHKSGKPTTFKFKLPW